MGKSHKKDKYTREKERAKSFYYQWRNQTTYSPAFKQDILVTRIGWHHLVGSRYRTKADRIRRFRALPLAKKLIETATTFQEHRYRHGVHYYALVAQMEGTRIKVILSAKKKDKKKNFLSIMVLA